MGVSIETRFHSASDKSVFMADLLQYITKQSNKNPDKLLTIKQLLDNAVAEQIISCVVGAQFLGVLTKADILVDKITKLRVIKTTILNFIQNFPVLDSRSENRAKSSQDKSPNRRPVMKNVRNDFFMLFKHIVFSQANHIPCSIGNLIDETVILGTDFEVFAGKFISSLVQAGFDLLATRPAYKIKAMFTPIVSCLPKY